MRHIGGFLTAALVVSLAQAQVVGGDTMAAFSIDPDAVMAYIRDEGTSSTDKQTLQAFHVLGSAMGRNPSETHKQEACDLAVAALDRFSIDDPEGRVYQANLCREIVRWAPRSAKAETGERMRGHLEHVAAFEDPTGGGLLGYAIAAAGAVCGDTIRDIQKAIMDIEYWKPLAEGGAVRPWDIRVRGFASSPVWAAMRASARTYRSDDIARCIEIVDAGSRGAYQKAGNARTHLVYLDRPEVVDYLVPLLDSDVVRDIFPHGEGGERTSAWETVMVLSEMLPEMAEEVGAHIAEAEKARGDFLPEPERIALYKEWLADRSRWEPLLQRE